MSMFRSAGRGLPIVLILLFATAAGLGLWLSARHAGPGPAVSPKELHSLLLYPQPRVLADFRLKAADGSEFTLQDWRGDWDLVFFGFTYCPDICPMSLAMMSALDELLAEAGSVRPRVTFVSVDPERDTPERLGEYVGWFNPAFRGVTGEHPQLQALARQLGVVYVRQELGNGDYTVDHSASILLIDPDGRLYGVFRPPHLARELASDIAIALGPAQAR